MSLFSVFCWSSFRLNYNFYFPWYTFDTRLNTFLHNFFCISSYKILSFSSFLQKLNTLNTSLPMGKTNNLTPRKKFAISALLQNTDKSQRVIARKMCISQASMSQIKKKLEKGEELATNRIGKCCAKRNTSPRVDRKLWISVNRTGKWAYSR